MSSLEAIFPAKKRKASSEAAPRTKKEKGEKKPRKPKAQSPLQKFRLATLSKRKDLKEARKKIDRDLKAIEKDLGVLKRPKPIKV